ncbi:division/cell wall cluster transcriptional repressor MraZ [Hyphococcus sp.]|uniref:division/cell wall cluster transcriptional repressor MraZ n=1 Tax=Hyphococcus sp. TaxID=2038636 RepID=UPI003CCBFB8A
MRRAAGARFFGSYVNKIDAKGRLATPALFRRALGMPEENVIYCAPSTEEPCIECGGADYIDNLMEMIDQLDPFSPRRVSLERIFATQMTPLSADKEGRINLPDALRKHAKLDGEALFAGHVRSFQIWNPEIFAEALEEAKKISSEARLSLRNPAPAGVGA